MSQPDTSRTFAHGAEVPATAAGRIWQAWCALSRWPDWDASLAATEATRDDLWLGKRFRVVPKAAPGAIPVSVTAFEEGRHFTTSSTGPLGLLSFGHALIPLHGGTRAELVHSVCLAVPDGAAVSPDLWERWQADVRSSVRALARLASDAEAAA